MADYNDGARGGALTPAQTSELVALFNAGRYVELEGRTRVLLERCPQSGFAWKVLGTCLQAQGKQALAALQKAKELLPDDAAVHFNLGNTLRDLGRIDEAVGSYRRAIEIGPGFAAAHYNLGNVLHELGRFEEAVGSYWRTIEIDPGFAEAHYNLGNSLRALARFDEAVTSYRRALQLRSDYAEAHSNLGLALQGLGRLDEAMASFRRALEINPDYAEAHSHLGVALKDVGRFDEAIASFRRAAQINPDHAEAHNNLGGCQFLAGNFDEAMKNYRRALEIKPDYADAHYNLGRCLQELAQLDRAMESYQHALRFNPEYAEVYNNLGGLLKDRGLLDDATASFRRALAINSGYVEAHSNLIFALDLSVGTDVAGLQQERRRWDEMHAAPLAAKQRPHANRRDPERRLRIGYVSADFRVHSAASVFGSMLVKFDHAGFEVFAYSNSMAEDAHTRLFKEGVSCWRKIAWQSDEAVAELIRGDEIDILVDLSGHSAGNRLLVFARKPAPIQVTAWGYATSTGLGAMDVFFADAVVVPEEERAFYTEEVRYLPSVVGSFFPQAFPAVNALPALSGGGVSFGSFNRLAKVTQQAFEAWARVLLGVPGSRLVLKTGELDDASARAGVREYFTKAGIAAERLVLLGKTSWQEHVAAFNGVDIALDPFPHGGGVTTLEGLMMGVPVVTLAWPTIAGRLSASILTTLGLTDWIARTPEQYVELAREKARGLERLAQLRQGLRARFSASIIGDAQAYVRTVEGEYRKLWQRWCVAEKDAVK